MKTHIKTIVYLLVALTIASLSWSCNYQKNIVGLSLWENKGETILTHSEIKKAAIKTEPVMTKVIEKYGLDCQATAIIAPSNIKYVSALLPGFIKEIYVSPGEFVKKGHALALMENDSYIQLQQDYLKAKARFEYLREDYKRQGILTIENAASIKKMQQAQNEYAIAESDLEALKLRLKRIGINPDSISAENLTSSIVLHSPYNGTINSIGLACGKFASQENCLFEIIESGPLMLQIIEPVRQSCKPDIQKGDTLFYIIDNNPSLFVAVIETKSIVPQSNDSILEITAKIAQQESLHSLKPGIQVHIKAYPYADTIILVPNHSILFDPMEPYIIIARADTFKTLPIKMGESHDDRTELINTSIPYEYEVVTYWKNVLSN